MVYLPRIQALKSLLIVFLCLISLVALIIYILRIKPSHKAGVKDLYSEGLDMIINGMQRSAYQNFKFSLSS